jgi:hypothetical protein
MVMRAPLLPDLGPVVTTHLFLQQILHGNTAVAHLRRLSGLSFTNSRIASDTFSPSGSLTGPVLAR